MFQEDLKWLPRRDIQPHTYYVQKAYTPLLPFCLEVVETILDKRAATPSLHPKPRMEGCAPKRALPHTCSLWCRGKGRGPYVLTTTPNGKCRWKRFVAGIVQHLTCLWGLWQDHCSGRAGALGVRLLRQPQIGRTERGRCSATRVSRGGGGCWTLI